MKVDRVNVLRSGFRSGVFTRAEMNSRRGRGTAAAREAAQLAGRIARGPSSSLVRQLRVYVLLLVVAVGGVVLLRSAYSVTKSSQTARSPPRVVQLEPLLAPPPPAQSERSVVEEVERIAELIQETLTGGHGSVGQSSASAADGVLPFELEVCPSHRMSLCTVSSASFLGPTPAPARLNRIVPMPPPVPNSRNPTTCLCQCICVKTKTRCSFSNGSTSSLVRHPSAAPSMHAHLALETLPIASQATTAAAAATAVGCTRLDVPLVTVILPAVPCAAHQATVAQRVASPCSRTTLAA